jgi:hypothetical protein
MTSNKGKQTAELLAGAATQEVHGTVTGFENEFITGNSCLNYSQEIHASTNDHITNEPNILSSHADTGGVQGTVTGPNITSMDFQTGNSCTNFSQGINVSNNAKNDICKLSSLPADSSILVTSQKHHEMGNKTEDDTLAGIDIFTATPVKRSKRRENSVDEDSGTRAERLKAKKNLDSPGMSTSKSFLSFSNDKIVSSITSLGISLGNEVDKGIENINILEHNRLLEASRPQPNNEKQCSSDDDDVSETDSDLVLDQHAIQYLVGDIADDIFGEHGSQVYDFKPTPRSRKFSPNKKKRGNKKVSYQTKRSK